MMLFIDSLGWVLLVAIGIISLIAGFIWVDQYIDVGKLFSVFMLLALMLAIAAGITHDRRGIK